MKKWFSLKRIGRLYQFLPVPLVLMIVSLGTVTLGLTSFLLYGMSDGSYTPSLSNDRLRHHISGHQEQTVTLRLHVVGPGRAKEWAPEHVRRFHFINELKYKTQISEQKISPVSETRNLKRYRSLLISSSTQEKLQLKRGITEILEDIGTSDHLLPLGQDGWSVGPIEPEKLPEKDQARLMNFIRGPSDPSSAVKNVIRYISPLEGQTFTLHHRIKNRQLSTSFPETQQDVTGLARNVLLHAPVFPELHLPDWQTKRDAMPEAPADPIIVSGFDRYVQSFFQSRLQGSLKLRPNTMNKQRITYSGSGSFNMFHRSEQRRIGEITIQHITINYQPRDELISRAELRGRIAVSSLPPGHVLRRITFLRTPEFRISYTSRRTTND